MPGATPIRGLENAGQARRAPVLARDRSHSSRRLPSPPRARRLASVRVVVASEADARESARERVILRLLVLVTVGGIVLGASGAASGRMGLVVAAVFGVGLAFMVTTGWVLCRSRD